MARLGGVNLTALALRASPLNCKKALLAILGFPCSRGGACKRFHVHFVRRVNKLSAGLAETASASQEDDYAEQKHTNREQKQRQMPVLELHCPQEKPADDIY